VAAISGLNVHLLSFEDGTSQQRQLAVAERRQIEQGVILVALHLRRRQAGLLVGEQVLEDASDEGVFATSWSATITYGRPLVPGLGEWPEYVCAENIHEYYGGKDTAVPRADKPDF
jgi:hypothetical protein